MQNAKKEWLLKIKTHAEDVTATLFENLDIHRYAPYLKKSTLKLSKPWLFLDKLKKNRFKYLCFELLPSVGFWPLFNDLVQAQNLLAEVLLFRGEFVFGHFYI